MDSHSKIVSHFEEKHSRSGSNQQQFSEIGIDAPKRLPMRRRSRQRMGGNQQKHKRNEKKINSRFKYQIDW